MSKIDSYHTEIQIISIKLDNKTEIRVWKTPMGSVRIQAIDTEKKRDGDFIAKEWKNSSIETASIHTPLDSGYNNWYHSKDGVTKKS